MRKRTSKKSAKVARKAAKGIAAKAAPTPRRRARMLVDDVTAILLVSPNAKKLCEFYRATLGLPLEEEMHDGMPLHYGCALGDVQFAIHPAGSGWPRVPTRSARSPVIAFGTSNLKAVARRLAASGVKITGPTDHGFAIGISFRDPMGMPFLCLSTGRSSGREAITRRAALVLGRWA